MPLADFLCGQTRAPSFRSIICRPRCSLGHTHKKTVHGVKVHGLSLGVRSLECDAHACVKFAANSVIDVGDYVAAIAVV